MSKLTYTRTITHIDKE